jgi:hypothetical protein
MTFRRLLPLTVALALLVAVPRALADADPPSDVLLGSPAFYPYQPAVGSSLQNDLQRTLAQLNRKGLNLKVAIVASATDLGAIPSLFGKPQTYADFLEREISFNHPQPLLVVMPEGFGIAGVGPPSALAGLKVDTSHRSNGLARSAILAVVKLAEANRKPVATGPLPSASGSSGGGTSPLITFGAPAIVVVLAALAAGRLRRRASAIDSDARADQES